MKSGKAVGPDKVHAEVLKTSEEDGLDAFTALFKKIYRTGVLLNDWVKSTFVPLPKTPHDFSMFKIYYSDRNVSGRSES